MDPPIFVSYVHDDAEAVARLCAELQAHGVKLWLDRKDLLPGVRWQDAIKNAIESGSYFLACFSTRSAKRARTYMNEELLLAAEELRMRPRERAWFLPVLLSAGEIPAIPIGAGETLRSIQHVDLSTDWSDGIRRLLKVLKPAGMSDENRLFAAARARVVTLIETLVSSEADARAFARRELAVYGTAAVPILAEAVEHEDPSIRSAAVGFLGDLGHNASNAVPALLVSLQRQQSTSNDPFDIDRLIVALGLIGDSHAVPALQTVFAKASTQAQDHAGHAMLKIGASGIQALVDSFRSGTEELRVRAASTLLHPPRAHYQDARQQADTLEEQWPDVTELAQAICASTTSTDPAVAKVATQGLQWVHNVNPDAARRLLIAALHRTEPEIRTAALSALSGMKLRHPDVKEALTRLENDPDPTTRREAQQSRRNIYGRWEPGPMGGSKYVGEDDDP